MPSHILTYQPHISTSTFQVKRRRDIPKRLAFSTHKKITIEYEKNYDTPTAINRLRRRVANRGTRDNRDKRLD